MKTRTKKKPAKKGQTKRTVQPNYAMMMKHNPPDLERLSDKDPEGFLYEIGDY